MILTEQRLSMNIENLSFDDIKKITAEQRLETDRVWIDLLLNDTRKTVSSFGSRLLRQRIKIEKEFARIEKMRKFEEEYSDKIVGGFDEAGRGPLAGPVVSAIVILKKEAKIMYLNDSKKLTVKQREDLYNEILENAVDFGIGIVENTRIDEINILNAVHCAAVHAFNNLRKMKPEVLLTDALEIKGLPETIKQTPIIKGDSKSVNIAAASIIAKVTRDRLMIEKSQEYPQYNFAVNKGYGTGEHINAIKKYGLCPIHRKTFCKNFIN